MPSQAGVVTSAVEVERAVPANLACGEENLQLYVTATDGGDKRYTLGDGGAIGGMQLTTLAGDGFLIINNSPVPLRCRSINAAAPKSSAGVTICNTTSCLFSNGMAEDWGDPAGIVCAIPAVNRDAGQLAFQVIKYSGCRK